MKRIIALIAISLTFAGCAANSPATSTPNVVATNSSCRWVPNHIRPNRDSTMCDDANWKSVRSDWENLRPVAAGAKFEGKPAK